jgi:uncharacterized protein
MIAIEFSYTTPSAERDRLRPTHRERLARLREEGKLFASGPWSDDTGALVIFDTSAEEAKQLVAGDPYFQVEGVTINYVREWNAIISPKA